MKNRQVNGRSLANVRGVHISAKTSRPETAELFVPFRCGRHTPEHRAQGDRYLLHYAVRQIDRSGHLRAVEPPDIPAVGESVVQKRRPAIRNKRAECAALR